MVGQELERKAQDLNHAIQPVSRHPGLKFGPSGNRTGRGSLLPADSPSSAQRPAKARQARHFCLKNHYTGEIRRLDKSQFRIIVALRHHVQIHRCTNQSNTGPRSLRAAPPGSQSDEAIKTLLIRPNANPRSVIRCVIRRYFHQHRIAVFIEHTTGNRPCRHQLQPRFLFCPPPPGDRFFPSRCARQASHNPAGPRLRRTNPQAARPLSSLFRPAERSRSPQSNSFRGTNVFGMVHPFRRKLAEIARVHRFIFAAKQKDRTHGSRYAFSSLVQHVALHLSSVRRHRYFQHRDFRISSPPAASPRPNSTTPAYSGSVSFAAFDTSSHTPVTGSPNSSKTRPAITDCGTITKLRSAALSPALRINAVERGL